MKIRSLALLPFAIAMGIHPTASKAAGLLLDSTISVTSKMGDSDWTSEITFKAIRDQNDCATWYLLPTYFENFPGDYLKHQVVFETKKGSDGKDLVTAKSKYDIKVWAHRPSEEALNALKAAIATSIKNHKEELARNPVAGASLSHKSCENIQPESITLSPLIAKTSMNRGINTSLSHFEKSIVPEGKVNIGRAVALTYEVDATADNVEPQTARDLTLETPTVLTDIQYQLEGITNLTASIAFQKVDLGELASTISYENSKSSSLNLALVRTATKFGPFSENSEFKFYTTQKFEYEYRTVVNECKNFKICESENLIPLIDWARARLFVAWLNENFELEETEGKRVRIFSKPNTMAPLSTVLSLSESVEAISYAHAPVLISRLSPTAFDKNLLSPALKCARKYYLDSVDLNNPESNELVPIFPACLK